MLHYVVGHYPVRKVFQDLCIYCQSFDCLVPKLSQSFDDLEDFERNFVLLYILLFPHFADSFSKAFKQPIFDHPDTEAVVDLVNLVISGLFGNDLMKELNARHIDVWVGMVENFKDRHKYFRFDYDGNMFLRGLLKMLKDVIDLLLWLIELHWLGWVLHAQVDVVLVQLLQLIMELDQVL